MIAEFLLMAAVAASPQVAPDADRRPVDVRTNGDEGLTQRLSDALNKSLDKGSRIRAMTPDDESDLALVIISSGAPEGKKFDYIVDLMKTSEKFGSRRIASLTGKCRESDLAACAADIVAAADRKIKKDG